MVKVNPLKDEDFKASTNYFTEGVYEVFLNEPTRGTSNNGTDYVQFKVLGPEDQTSDVRLYLSEKAWPYTARTLSGVAVHNKKTEADKGKVREAFKAIDDTDKLDEAFLAKFDKMQAWVLVEEDPSAPKPNGGFYLKTNLYSYPPKPKKTTVNDLFDGEPADGDDVPFK